MKNREIKRLEELRLPYELKKLTIPQCRALCREIRKILIRTVAENGGHLSSNLGTVELTLAIHRVFDSPRDRIIWDVGHQAYTHKLLTGRLDRFSTLRKEYGISGFAKPEESEHDIFIAGHSSNSISAACGIAEAMHLKGDEHHVIAVIGDGAFTGGMAYEGLNNAGKSGRNLIVILNDNEMSISKNVGAVPRYLASLRGKKAYVDIKRSVERALDNTPVVGKPVKELMVMSKNTARWILYNQTGTAQGSTMFENLGFMYLGPVDGHDIRQLEENLRAAKAAMRPVLVHVKTVKGKGYTPAEKNPGAYHGVSPGAMKNGDPEIISEDSFSAVFGKELSALAEEDKRICAITAAMKYGTGLNFFAARHPDRFFDVGIAEQHALTFSAGLAVGGRLPVFAVYSSFLQRAYDQIIHDAAICRTHIVLGIDRAGIVGEDGETHQGLFDTAMLTCIPNVTVFSPSDYNELRISLKKALYECRGVAAVRYPKGKEESGLHMRLNESSMRCYERMGGRILAVGYGRTGLELYAAIKENGLKCDILKPVKIFPIDRSAVNICMGYEKIIIFEETLKNGGVGEHLAAMLSAAGYEGKTEIHAVNGFVKQAKCEDILKRFNLDRDSMTRIISENMQL